jgi:hypothetical protein
MSKERKKPAAKPAAKETEATPPAAEPAISFTDDDVELLNRAAVAAAGRVQLVLSLQKLRDRIAALVPKSESQEDRS